MFAHITAVIILMTGCWEVFRLIFAVCEIMDLIPHTGLSIQNLSGSYFNIVLQELCCWVQL